MHSNALFPLVNLWSLFLDHPGSMLMLESYQLIIKVPSLPQSQGAGHSARPGQIQKIRWPFVSLSLSLCLSVSHTNRCNTMAAKHADPWWFALKRPATRLHVLKQAASYRVRPFQNPCQAMSSHSQVNLIRSGMVRRIVAWLQRWCVRYALAILESDGNWVALHWLDVIKSNWIPGHRFLCWFLMRNGDWKRLRNLESGSPRGTWACHSLPTVLLISFRRWRGICFVKGDALLQFANSEGLTFTERSKSQKCRRAA